MGKRGLTGAMTRMYGAQDHQATVTGTELIAPGFLRIRLISPTLLDDIVLGPTAFLRFWFPDPAGGDVEHQRAYTLVEANPQTGEFAVDVVLHEPSGPAATWARHAEAGMSVAVNTLGSTRFDVPPELPAGYLLVGDAASIPAISAILAELPDDVAAEVYLEQRRDEDRLIPLTHHPRATVTWVPRQGEQSLAAAITARDWSDWYAWLAPESGSLKYLRSRLREEFGFPKAEIHGRAYWFYGRAFGKNRSTGEAEVAFVPAETAPPADVTDSPQESPISSASPHRGRWQSDGSGRLLAPLRATLIVAAVVQGLTTLVQLAPFVVLVELCRLVLIGADAGALIRLGLVAAALMGLGVLLSAGLMWWLHRVDARFARELRQRLLTTLGAVPLGWFDARGSGQVKQIVQDDTLSLHYLITHAVPDAVAAVVAPLAVLVYLVIVDWRLGLVLLLPVLVYVVAMAIMTVSSGQRTAEAVRWAERMNGEATAYLDGQPVIRVFGGATGSTFHSRLGEYVAFLDNWQRPLSGQKAFIDLVTRPATFLLLISVVGTLLITTAGMEPTALLPFLFLGTTFGARLLGIGYGLVGLRTGTLAARRIQATLDQPPLGAEPGHDLSPTSAPDPVSVDATPPPERPNLGAVEVENIGFAYRPGVPVLQDVTLALRPGTVTALVGPSGSGKSTLASLLARFHDVDTGAIRIDGVDIRDLSADQLYSTVGFVFQQTQLVHGTVRENIALAVPDAPLDKVEEAARAAQIHDRILQLPAGYDTVLGSHVPLSGGEQQRLTIARAILADTPVLVLDEATAFADPESEYLVQRALDRLTRGRTVVVIAHRLHTITDVEQIVVLDHGRVVETGTHQTLLERGGRYRQLWDAGKSAQVSGVRP